MPESRPVGQLGRSPEDEGMGTEATEPMWAVVTFAVVTALATLVILAAVVTGGF